MPLSDRAAAMYKNWYPWVADAVRDTLTTGKAGIGLSAVQEAISTENQRRGLPKGSYDPIGVSQLYGQLNSNFRASYNLSQAPESAQLTGNMIGSDLFGRGPQEQAVNPIWRATIQATYIDQFGVTQQDTFTQFYYTRLPPTVGSLRQHVELDVQDMLNTPPPSGTPRSGQLVSVDQIQLLAA